MDWVWIGNSLSLKYGEIGAWMRNYSEKPLEIAVEIAPTMATRGR